jgi:hypothetical protein
VRINGQKRAISLKSWILLHASVPNTLKKNDVAHLGLGVCRSAKKAYHISEIMDIADTPDF